MLVVHSYVLWGPLIAYSGIGIVSMENINASDCPVPLNIHYHFFFIFYLITYPQILNSGFSQSCITMILLAMTMDNPTLPFYLQRTYYKITKCNCKAVKMNNKCQPSEYVIFDAEYPIL